MFLLILFIFNRISELNQCIGWGCLCYWIDCLLHTYTPSTHFIIYTEPFLSTIHPQYNIQPLV